MIQEFFFDCIESLLKKKRSESARRPELVPNRYKRSHSQDRAKYGIMKQSTSATEVLQKQRAFEKTSDKDKQQVLLDFIQNKAVL